MRDVTFFSQALQRDMHYRVLLPETNQGRKLVVVYLLHGGGGTFRDWSNYSDVAQFADGDLLFVMPQGDYSYYTNAALRPQDRYEDYIVDDLAADVEHRFPVRTDRAGRAVAGVSMGGFGAIKLALRHPDRYVFAAALSAALDVPRRRFNWRRLNQSRSYREIFGPDGSETRRAGDPFLLVTSADSSTAPFFYFTCGRQESLLAPNREFATLLDGHRSPTNSTMWPEDMIGTSGTRNCRGCLRRCITPWGSLLLRRCERQQTKGSKSFGATGPAESVPVHHGRTGCRYQRE
jgi:S-formylglutathione hydrolase FrmB